MVNRIWAFLILIGSIYFILTGNISRLNETILSSGKNTLDLIVKIFPIMCIWLGIMNIAQKSGLLSKLSSFFSPILHFLFPDIPKKHPSFDFISSNIVANMFGLGSAATPSGLKAMNSLQELNRDKNVATRSMITFLVINTSGVTLIPTTVISMRMMYESKNPTEIILVCILTTIISMICAVIIDRLYARRNRD